MKTFKKLHNFAAMRYDKKEPESHKPIHQDELVRATQDMSDMRDCYDGLLSAAAATANSVYEFSESLTEMGDCLLEKTALNDDEESGKVLLMLGKVQFELQKLVDAYRSHIFRTITVPSESLLKELSTVEEMKIRCEEKKEIYEDMMKKQKEKRRLRGSKGGCFSLHQLQAAHDEYDEEANVFVSRVTSLKQAQSRSLLTQATRHHAAQLCFLKKAVKSLEAIEPDVRLVSEQKHIDYQFSELIDDELELYDDDDETTCDEYDDTEDDSETIDGGEISFEHARNSPVQEDASVKHLMQVDDKVVSPETKLSASKKHFPSRKRNCFSFQREIRAISRSAPLFSHKKPDSTQSSTASQRKLTSYVLPTPDQTSGPVSGKMEDNRVAQTKRPPSNPWHSSPLNSKYDMLGGENDKFSGPIILDTQSVLKESTNINTRKHSQLPPPLSQGLSFKQYDPNFASDAKKVKRQAFSGPITGKTTWTNSTNSKFTASGPISPGYPSPFSGPLLRAPLPQPASAPKISELHELPRPPTHSAAKNPTIHSGPLTSLKA